jgi:hypothetical protein
MFIILVQSSHPATTFKVPEATYFLMEFLLDNSVLKFQGALYKYKINCLSICVSVQVMPE